MTAAALSRAVHGTPPASYAASGARSSSRRKQRCWIFHVSGITRNVPEGKLLASVRERYTTVKRLVVTSAPKISSESSGHDVLVEVQFTGPQPSEGPGALLCDLLCGSGIEARPVELPRGRKKRARSDAGSSEASDSDVEDGASRKMSSHRSTGSLELVGEEDEEDSSVGGQCITAKPVLVGQGQGGSPIHAGNADEPDAPRLNLGRDSGGLVAPSAVLGRLTRPGLFTRPSASSASTPPRSVSASVIVPAETRGSPIAGPALTRGVVSLEGIAPPLPRHQQEEEKQSPKQQSPQQEQSHQLKFKVDDGRGDKGEQWDEVVRRLEPPQNSGHSLEFGSIDLSSNSSSQNPIKTKMEPLLMSISSNSNGTWNSNDSQMALLGRVSPPQSTVSLRGWPLDPPSNVNDARGDFGGGSAVMDVSDMENLFRSADEDGGAHTPRMDSNVTIAISGGSNADAGAGEGQPHRQQAQTRAQPQEEAPPAKWMASESQAMENVLIEPSRKECDFEGRPLSGNTVGQSSSAPSAQCHLVFTGLDRTGYDLSSLRVTAHFGVDGLHKVGKVTLPIQAGSNGRAYAAIFYPSMQEIWPELFNTTNIRVVEVDVIVEIRAGTGEYQYVGPQLKVSYLRAPPDGFDLESNSVSRRSVGARSPLSSMDDTPQVSYSCVGYSCGDWFADMCQSVFRPNADAHQPLIDDSHDDLMSG